MIFWSIAVTLGYIGIMVAGIRHAQREGLNDHAKESLITMTVGWIVTLLSIWVFNTEYWS